MTAFLIYAVERPRGSVLEILHDDPCQAVQQWASAQQIDETTRVILEQPNASPYPYIVRKERDGYVAVGDKDGVGQQSFDRIDAERAMKISVDAKEAHYFLVASDGDSPVGKFHSEESAISAAKKMVYDKPSRVFDVYMKCCKVNRT